MWRGDPEAFGFFRIYHRPTFIHAFRQAAINLVDQHWGQYGGNGLPLQGGLRSPSVSSTIMSMTLTLYQYHGQRTLDLTCSIACRPRLRKYHWWLCACQEHIAFLGIIVMFGIMESCGFVWRKRHKLTNLDSFEYNLYNTVRVGMKH